MNTYRKKPVLIEAAQYDGTSFTAQSLADWCGGYVSLIGAPERQVIYIETLEGRMMADVNVFDCIPDKGGVSGSTNQPSTYSYVASKISGLQG